jgi:ribosome-associated translation inhibitor RaiA
MTIQFSSAHHVYANEALKAPLLVMLTEKLNRFSNHIARLDVHLSDENGAKEGVDDKQCVLEAHLDGMEPIVAKNHANTYQLAAEGAVDKLKGALNTKLGRLGEHRKHDSEHIAPASS